MPRGRNILPPHIGSSLWKSAATAIVYQETIGGIAYVVAVDGTTHAQISGPSVLGTEDVTINATLVYVNALGGGLIYIEQGDYTLTATLTMYASIQIVGAGYDTHLTGAGNFNLITVSSVDNIALTNFRLSGTSTGNTVSPIFIEDGSDDFRVDGIWITDSDLHGIHVTGTGISAGWIIDCNITGPDLEGIFVIAEQPGNNMDDFHIVDNYIADCGQNGLQIQYTRYSEVANNIITGCTSNGIYLTSDTTIITVSDNIIYECTLDGIQFESVNLNIISGNIIYSNGRDGISLEGPGGDFCTENNIVDNYCVGNEDGISLANGSNNNYLNGNFCTDNTGYGVILTATSSNNFVKDNYLTGNTTGAISDGGTDTRVHEVDVLAPNPDSYIGQHASQQMLDGVVTNIRFETAVPEVFQELVSAEVIVVPEGTGNLACINVSDYGRICHSEAYNAHDGSVDYTIGDVLAVVANRLECLDVTDMFTAAPLTAYDWIGTTFIRSGAEAADTVGAVVQFLGFKLRYV